MTIRGRVKKLEGALAGPGQADADALRTWRLAVEWTEWAYQAHGGRDAALASGNMPPDSLRFTAFTWQLDDFMAPLLPEESRLGGDWKRAFRCALSVILDAEIANGVTRADLQGPDALAGVIGWCADLIRQSLLDDSTKLPGQ